MAYVDASIPARYVYLFIKSVRYDDTMMTSSLFT